MRYKRKKRTEKQGKRGEYVCEIKGKKQDFVSFLLYHEQKGKNLQMVFPFYFSNPLFICAVCINYRLNLLHKGIIVVLVINSAEHWFAYNIAISVNKYSCWKRHDF